MSTYIGLDGFRRGWVAVYIDDNGDHFFDYSPELRRLLSGTFKRAMLDVPIGLPDKGYRQCDIEARGVLGTSVFLGARRSLIGFDSFNEANKYYWRTEGAGWGISQQLWGIRDKIAQADALVTPKTQHRICEAHPEAVFRRLNSGQRELDSKHTETGWKQRLDLLNANGFGKADRWMDLRFGTGIGRDDLIDACACAVAARDSQSAFGGKESDTRGLRMEINF